MKLLSHFIITLCLLTAFSLYSAQVTLVDYNQNDCLQYHLPTNPTSIAIFGATPRYSFMLKYQQTLCEHIQGLNGIRAKSRLLKTVSRKVKRSFKELGLNIGYENMYTYFATMPFDQLVDLFFNCAIDTAAIVENAATLLQSSTAPLLHILFPHYFDDCISFYKNGLLSEQQVYYFLLRSAYFYKDIYENLLKSVTLNSTCCVQNITIVIPPLSYFKQVLEVEYKPELKNITIASLLYNLLFDTSLSAHRYILVNPIAEEIQPVATELYKRGVEAPYVQVQELKLYRQGSRSRTFTPYVLQLPKAPTQIRESVLICPDLLDYLQSKVS
ncbi:hypothetical protein H0X48_00490 [Candidatus Dependentiae bacterium]|nr:hypothetical protein [Candidatus Dependentiae bacterium]